MNTRILGRTGIALTTLGLGTTSLGGMYRAQSEAGADAAFAEAHRLALRYIDTAPLYGFGLAELRTGRALRRLPPGVVISTKLGWQLHRRGAGGASSPAEGLFEQAGPFAPRIDYSYDGAMRSIEDSLQRLGVDRVDVLFLHDCDRRNHGEDGYRDRFREAMGGAYRALIALRDQGVTRAIGCGLNEWEACQDFAEAGDFDCFLLAGRYTLLDQGSLDSFLPLCDRRGIGVVLGGPYNSGILATGAADGAMYDYAPATLDILERARAIEAVCASHGVPLRAAALQFPLTHPAITSVIPGARDAAEIAENVALMARAVPPALWEELRHAGLIR